MGILAYFFRIMDDFIIIRAAPEDVDFL